MKVKVNLKKYFPCQDIDCREQSRAVFTNRWVLTAWGGCETCQIGGHGLEETVLSSSSTVLPTWEMSKTSVTDCKRSLARELLNAFNCFECSVPVLWVHLLPLQPVTTSTSCSLPGGTELLLYRLAGNRSQCEGV